MSLRLTLILTASLSMSACATVDLNDIGAKSTPAASKTVDVNVVQRAASKLYAAFSSRGFVTMAPSEKSLRKELVSLEKALIASREASQVFEDALLQTEGTAETLDYKAYVSSVGELRDVTNAFGDRVREAQMMKSRTASNPIAAF